MFGVKRHLEDGERLETRSRPARKPRWKGYLPALVLGLAGLFAFLATDALLARFMTLRLTELGALLTWASVLLLVGTGAVAILRVRPFTTFIVGATALSLGGNLLAGRAVVLPLLAAGLLWAGALELLRWTNGLVLTDRRVVLPRPLRRPLAIPYDEVLIVHTTGEAGRIGSLILETPHGTLAAPDLPAAQVLRGRIEARRDRATITGDPTSVAEARGRIERLLRGA